MTIQQFAKKITHKNVDEKMEAGKKIQKQLESGKNPDGSVMAPAIKRQLEALQAWLLINIMVGEELCPADSVTNHLRP